MTRTQIQLPDDLYQRAKRFAASRELSLAELTRRGIELFLDRYPETTPKKTIWSLPKISTGGIKVPLEALHEASAKEEEIRSQRGI